MPLRSVGISCRLRTQYDPEMEEEKKITCSKRELRNRAKASLEQEARILDELLSEAATSAVVIVPALKPAVEARLGKPLAPDTSHLQADLAAREAWKKLPERLAEEVGSFCGLAPAATNVSGRSTFRPHQRCAALLGQAIPSSVPY